MILACYTGMNEDQIKAVDSLRGEHTRMRAQIMQLVPPGPSRANALDRLDECFMWANRGIGNDWQALRHRTFAEYAGDC